MATLKVVSLIMFVIWKLMGSPYGFETAYRSVAYSAAIFPIVFFLNLVPYVGSIIGVCWAMYLLFTASQEVHGTSRQTAMMVFGVLALLAVFFQISSEIATRKMSAKMEEFGGSMEEFGKSMEKVGEAMEDSEGVETMEQMGKQLEGMEDLSPEEAGKKLGEFFKGMEQAMEKTQEEAQSEAE